MSLSIGDGYGHTHLLNRRCWNTYSQTTTAYGWDDLAGGITTENKPTGGSVFLHGPPEGVLSILSEMLHLGQQNH